MRDNQTSTGEHRSPRLGGWPSRPTGGLVGVGRGSIVLESSGRVLVNGPTRPGRPGGSREARLSETELRGIAEAVQDSRPTGWTSSKLTHAAPDAFGYVLELRRGSEIHKAVWYDNSRSDLPADLAELYARTETTWNRVSENRDS